MATEVLRIQLWIERPGPRFEQPGGSGRRRRPLRPPRLGRSHRASARSRRVPGHRSQDGQEPIESGFDYRRRIGAAAGVVQRRCRAGTCHESRLWPAVLLHDRRRFHGARDSHQRLHARTRSPGADYHRSRHRTRLPRRRAGRAGMRLVRLSPGVRSARRRASEAKSARSTRGSQRAEDNAMTNGDADARRAIAEALDDTLVVEAAAGTGKTTELVTRILRVLATGRAKMIEIVAVTFTEKAAGELKLRLREALEHERAAASDEDVRQRLEHALETLEEATVNTIHGICAEMLRERPVEACVDPLFAVLTEPQADRMYGRAFRAWLQEALENPPEGLRRALRRTSAPAFQGNAGDSDGPIDRLRRAGRTLAEWRDFPQPWHRSAFDRAVDIEVTIAALHRLADLTAAASSARDNLFIDTDGARRLSRQIRLEESFGQRDLDGWEARLVDLTRDRGFSRTRKGSGYKYGRNVNRSDVLAARDALFAALQQFRRDADADLSACLQQELAGATQRYQTLKNAAGALDFTDLLARARDLIRTNAAVRLHLQQKFTRIFVDEFQDTDPIQAEILLLLAADVRGKLFIVGDPKQAIYRFRGTDVGTYWRVRDELVSRGARVLQLTTGYASLPSIQRFRT